MLPRLIAMVSMVLFLSAHAPAVFAESVAQDSTMPALPAQITGQAPMAQAPTQSSVPSAAHTVTVAAGTAIPLTLINPIRSKSSKAGDVVRATVAFPVTVGTEVAIPAGSYAEGTLDQVVLRSSAGQPQVKIHFTRLLFANGYSVPLDADNTQAELDAPAAPSAAIPQIASADAAARADAAAPGRTAQPHLVRTAYGLDGQQQPTPPTLPQVGPSPAVVIGAVMGGGAAVTIGALLWAHHRATSLDYVLFDAGWQFQIVLQQPLTIDMVRTATAAAAPAGQ